MIASAVGAQEHDLWVDSLGAPTAPQHPAAVARWHWSTQCPPIRMTEAATALPCQGDAVTIAAVNPAGEPLPGVQLRWSPRAMRREVPENLLPVAVTSSDGTVQLPTPTGERLWVRVAGPAWASPWRELAAGHHRITASPGTEVEFSSPSAGWTRVEWWSHGERLWGVWVIPPNDRLPVWVPAGLDGTALSWGHESPPFAVAVSRKTLLTPPPAVRVEVHVADGERQPVAGVEVSTLLPVPGAPRAVPRRCVTADDGSCALPGLPVGPITLAVAKSGWVPRSLALLATPPAITFNVQLDRGRPGVVTVRSAAGGPVAGAEIFLPPSRLRLGTTDAAGEARSLALPTNEAVALGISADGFLEGRAIVPAQDPVEVNVVLTPAARLAGNVVLADGAAPVGGTIVLEWPDGSSRLEALPGSGRVEVGDLPAGKLEVELRADGAVPLRLPQHELRAGETWEFGTVVLEQGATVTGRVAARGTGEGIANARVRLPRPHQFGPRLSAARGDFVETLSGEGGIFELRGVPPGGHPVLVEAPGFAPRLIREVLVRWQEEAPVDVGTIALDQDLALVVRCTPAQRCGNRAVLLLGGEGNDWAFLEEAMTEGRAHFSSVPADDLTLQLRSGSILRATRAVAVSPKERLTVIEIALEEGRLEGVVRWDGRPAREGVLELRKYGSPAPPAVLLSRGAPGLARPSSQIALGSTPEELSTALDSEGKFSFAAVPPGEYRATVRGPWGVSPHRTITVAAKATTNVVLDFPTGRVVGEVLDTRGQPQTEGTVQILAGTTLVGSTSFQNGRFTMAGLAPDRYQALARTSSGSGQVEFSCRSGELTEVRILVDSESPPETIQVTDGMGQPVTGAAVLALTPAGWRLAYSDSTGIARPGGHQLLAAAAYRADLGFVASSCSASGPCALAFAANGGTLEILQPRGAPVALTHPSGVPLHLLVGATGSRWVTPCRIPGLPAGTYSLTLGDTPPRPVVVRARQTTVVGQ